MDELGTVGLLKREDFVPTGGMWAGHLFANPRVGVGPELFWSFMVDCERVELEVGMSSEVTLAVEWAPVPGFSWHSMPGARVSGQGFGAPVESSVYFFNHHRYDDVGLRVLEQRDGDIRVDIALRGDLDGLGLDTIELETWLRFDGITVDLPGIQQREDAWSAMSERTDTTGLRHEGKPHQLRFRPPHRR